MIADRLKDPTLPEMRGYVDGSWIDTAPRFAVIEPATSV